MRLTKRQLKRIIREEYSRLKRRGLIREMPEPRDSNVSRQAMYSGYGGPPAVYTAISMAIAKVMNKQGGMWIQKKRNAHRSLKNAVNTIVTKDRAVKSDYFPIRDNPAYDEALQEIIDGLAMDEKTITQTLVDYLLS